MIRRLLDWLLPAQDLVVSDDQEYLRRWTIFHRPSGRSLYIHRMTGDDWTRHPHDHPKNFWSIGLWGSYVEEVHVRRRAQRRWIVTEKTWHAPWVRRFGGELIHRLRLNGSKSAWTLVYTGPYYKDWGFYLSDGTFISHKEYLS